MTRKGLIRRKTNQPTNQPTTNEKMHDVYGEAHFSVKNVDKLVKHGCASASMSGKDSSSSGNTLTLR